MIKNDYKIFKDVSELTAVTSGVSVREILGKKRSRELVIPRMVIGNILNIEMKYRKQDIAKYLNRDRTSIYHYMNTHKSNYQYWEEYRELYDEIKAGYLGIDNADMTKHDMDMIILKSDIISNPYDSRFMISFKIGTAETNIFTNTLEKDITTLKRLFKDYNFIFKVEHRNNWSYAL